ncbi:L-asparaginase [Allocatelliglobosispora scoriae]|uniref:L-asparaginase n=1 Tax=Allocatelliglobosispora scoriae TaxID=643052 RepID=A0A841BN93_9ACTN|nr:asparaginase domain-containing protein [Allocatelliglobosispora scoriae]MBB5868301.1 L-asparaginase [Allocatelliglobosispora scoriae]
MSRILLLATGDTIAQSRDTVPPFVATAEQLLAAISAPTPGSAGALPPGIQVIPVDVMAEPSWDTSPTTMLALARRARGAILDDGFDGVVITHGVDTIEETAWLVDLLAGPAARRGAIVLTGAVHCLDGPASDGPANLAAAITAAADPAMRGAGAVVCTDGELHAARWATLRDATAAAGFSSAPHPVLGRVTAAGVELLTTPPPRPPDPPGEPEADVALIKTYPGMEAVLLTAALDAGARGVVLEGTGLGNIPVGLFAAISDLIEWDFPVVIASRSRTGGGSLDDLPLGTGLAGKLGAIGARGLSGPKARCALMVALGAGGVVGARAWFDQL